MSLKKALSLEQANVMVTTMNGFAHDKSLGLLKDGADELLDSNAGHFLLMMWFESAFLMVLENKRVHEMAATLRGSRVHLIAHMHGVEPELIETVIDNYRTAQNIGISIGTPNFMLIELLLYLEVPEDEVVEYASRFDATVSLELTEIMIEHAELINAFYKNNVIV